MSSGSHKKDRSKVIGILLFNAIENNDMPLLQRLLSKFTAEEVNEGSLPCNYTPLHAAAGCGNVEALGELLKKKDIDLNIRGGDGYTPIMVAAWACNVAVVKQILEQPSVNLDYRDKLGRTIAELAGQGQKLGASSRGEVEEIKKMIRLGKDHKDRIERRIRSQSINRLLCEAIHNDDWVSVKSCLKFCTTEDLNKLDMNGYMPLHWACVRNNKDIVNLLVECEDVDVNAVDEDGSTPDMRAAWICSNDCLKLLLQNERVHFREAELVTMAGKAFVCSNEQKNETTAIINKEIARRKFVAEIFGETSEIFWDNSAAVVPKICLFHLHQKRMK